MHTCTMQALAIIRQKPEGVSAKDYTSRLALQFNQLQTNWREKATQLERELLRTRQELATFQVRCELVGGNDLHTHPHPSHRHTSHPYIDAVHRNATQSSHEFLIEQPSQDQGISTQGSIRDSNPDTNTIAMDTEWTSSGYSSSLTQETDETGELEKTTLKQNCPIRETTGMTRCDGYSLDNQSIQVEPMDIQNSFNKVLTGHANLSINDLTGHAQLSKHTVSVSQSDSCNQLADERCKERSEGIGDTLQERVRSHVKFCSSGVLVMCVCLFTFDLIRLSQIYS